MDMLPSGLQIMSAGFFACIGGIAGALIRQRGPWRAQEIQADQTFQTMLLTRIDKLESDQKIQDVENRADRHKMANIEQCFNTLVISIKRSPEHASDAADMVLALRAKQEEREAEERATIVNAKIIGSSLAGLAAQEAQA